MASITKRTRTQWRVSCRGVPQHNSVFKHAGAAEKYARQMTAEGLIVQVSQVDQICWLARVRGREGTDIASTFDSRALASAWAKKIEGEMVDNRFVDPRESSRVTLGELLQAYDNDYCAQQPISDPQRTRIRNMREHPMARIRMNALSPRDVRNYRDERLQRVKGSTVTREMAILCKIINLAMKEGDLALPFNPASGERVARPPPQPGDMRDRRLKETHSATPHPIHPAHRRKKTAPATGRGRPEQVSWVLDDWLIRWMQMPQSEEQLLLRACRYPHWFRPHKVNPREGTLRDRAWRIGRAQPVKSRDRKNGRLWALVSFAVQTAMRRGELLKLKWAYVHLQLGYLDLPGSITKNKRPRIVPLSRRAIRILQTQPRTSEFVFPHSEVMVKQAFERARERAQASDLRLHDLRHEATSRLFENTTLRESEIGDITGHLDPRMLQRYYNKRPQEFVKRFHESFVRRT